MFRTYKLGESSLRSIRLYGQYGSHVLNDLVQIFGALER